MMRIAQRRVPHVGMGHSTSETPQRWLLFVRCQSSAHRAKTHHEFMLRHKPISFRIAT